MELELKKHFDNFVASSHAGHKRLQELVDATTGGSSSGSQYVILSSALDFKLEIHREVALLKRKLIKSIGERGQGHG